MKKKNLLTAILLLMAGTAMAQNALQVEDFTLPQNGGEIAMSLTLDEADKYVSYQFKIQTPTGVGYVVDSEDDVECVLGTGHAASHAATAHWNASINSLKFGTVQGHYSRAADSPSRDNGSCRNAVQFYGKGYHFHR